MFPRLSEWGVGMQDLGGLLTGFGGNLYVAASWIYCVEGCVRDCCSFWRRLPDENERVADCASDGTRNKATE
jgi:hypothetical protein